MRVTTPGGAALWLAAAVLFLLPGRGLAHRVNVFAYVEGDTVHVECGYSRSDRVRFGAIEVKNAATNEVYLSGKTDEKGNFSFAVPEPARKAKADLLVVLRAGEGHGNDWTVKAGEYLTAGPAGTSANTVAAVPDAVPPARQDAGVSGGRAGPAATPAASSVAPPVAAADLEAVVEAAVEKKIAPLRQMLLEEREKGPGMAEIMGGIGWLVGLAGILAYAGRRKGNRGA